MSFTEESVRLPVIDAVVCCVDDERFASFSGDLRSQLAGFGLRDIIRISDAAAMHDGYNRGAEKSDSEWLLFCHDDIRVLAINRESWTKAMAESDLFGPCGTNLLQGANWYESDPNHLYGSVVAPRSSSDGFEHQVFGKTRSLVSGAQAIDGLFMMSRRSVWENIKFSSDFTGFTLYDIDYSYRAHLRGYRVAILADLLLLHYSLVSEFSAVKLAHWKSNQEKFLEKFNFRQRGSSYVKHSTSPYEDVNLLHPRFTTG
ncbi:glycosyltransferase [Methylobacterium sp. Leaf113]|uniref:glycosyltransferase n=1 Tax=Methylobacterium sp. Leaf113 TaxID=1736259 RepID=UPI0009E907C9|nr:glycosyltransferase [Methylobacterium sp. Leaf113]